MELPIPVVTTSHVIDDISVAACVNELHWLDQETVILTMVCGMCVCGSTQDPHVLYSEYAAIL